MSLRISYLIVPITIVITAVITIVLAVCGQGWYYYLIGALVGLLNHGLMVKQAARIERFANLDPEGKTLKPKRTAALWYFLRVLVFVGVFAVLAFRADLKNDPQGIWYIITALGGYLTLKVVLIICLIICRGKVKE